MFYDQFKKLCDKNGITMTKLITSFGMSRGNLGSWKNGGSPSVEVLQKISDYFGVTTDYLLTGKVPKTPDEILDAKSVGNMVPVPLIASVRAGWNGTAFEDFQGFEWADVKDPEEYRFFRVKGDSMEPQISEGDLALVHIQPDVESGELAVVIVNGEDGCLKKVIKQGSSVILQSFNPNYPPRVFSEKESEILSIYGKVIETKRKW